MLTKLKKWIQKHHLVELDFVFSDADRFHQVTVAHSPETTEGSSLDFGKFAWVPERTDVIGGKRTPADICMLIESDFEKRIGIRLWTETDICRRIRRALESGKSTSVGFLFGLTWYRINIKFITEK